MNSPLRCLIFSIIATLGCLPSVRAGIVTNTADSGAGSLRDVLNAATPSGDTITFDPSLNGATIVLTSNHLLIDSRQVTIDASSLPAGISLSGNNLNRAFFITGITSDVTLRNLQIRDGRAINTTIIGNGGGILLGAGNLTLTNCTIKDCFATANGGAVFLNIGVTSTFDRCTIVGNSNQTGLGGGIAVSGAATTLFRSCVISGNVNPSSGGGGGLGIVSSSPSFINCTIQGNSGCGFRHDTNSDPAIVNTIIWGNRDTTGNTASQQIRNGNTTCNPAVSHSLIEGASGSSSFADGNAVVWGTGNLNGTLAQPKFATEIAAGSAPHSGGDLRLLHGSPALNQGDNLAGIGSLNLAGSARIQDSTVDLGAYEGYFVRFSSLHPSLTPTADDNHNGVSNFQEYAMGFDPSSTTNPQVGPALSSAGGNAFLTVNQRPNGLDFSPLLATSTSLDSWTGMVEGIHYAVESATTASSDRKVLFLRLMNTTDPKRFFRQGVTTSN